MNYETLSRRELKRERARHPLAKQRVAEVDGRLAELERERDASEAQYQRDVQPLQREIADIEEASIEDIQQRRPLDPAREQRRKKLAFEIEQAAVRLAAKIADIDARVEITRAERAKLMADLPNTDLINSKLLRTAPEEQQIRHQGLLEAARGIESGFLFSYRSRVESVRDAMKTAESNGDKGRAEDYKRQLRRMEAVLSAAGSATKQLHDDARQLYKELIEA